MKKLMKKFLASAIASAMLMTGMPTTDATAKPVEQSTVAEQLAMQTQDQAAETATEQPQQQVAQEATSEAISAPKPSKFVQLDKKEITMEVGETIQGKLVTDAIVDKSGWEADKVSTSDKSVVGLCNKDRYAGTIDYVAKKAGTVTVTWKLRTDKRKKNNVKTLTCVITVVEPQPTIQTEVTVANQQELVAAIMNTDINKITIKTDKAETFTIANFGNRDLSQVELVVNAPHAEISNSALFKSITIEAIASNTWTEHSKKGNSFIISALNCHMIVATSAEVKTISYTTEGSFDLEVHGSIGKVQFDRKVSLNIDGSTKKLVPVIIGTSAMDTTLLASVPVDVTLETLANLTFEKGAEASKVTNKAGVPLTVKTPSGVLTIGVGSVNIAISSSSNSNWSNNSPWFPPTWENGNPDKGENGNNDSSDNNGTNGDNGNQGGEGNGNNNSGGNQGGNSNKPEDPVNPKPEEPVEEMATLTVLANNAGGSVYGTATVKKGTTANFGATPNSGYKVVWNDGSEELERSVVMDKDMTFTATFIKIEEKPIDPPTPPTPSEEDDVFKLEIACGEGGYVTIEGMQQNAFSVTSPSSLEFVTAEAHPNQGYHFGKWNDGDTSSTKTVPVVFGTSVGLSCSFEPDQVIPPTPEMVTISVSAANEGGSVYGSATVEKGSTVSFGAIPNEGYTVLWNDGSIETERIIEANDNLSFVATFIKEEEPPVEDPVTVTFVANGKIVKECTVNKGSSPEIPNPDDCYVFGKKLVAWEVSGVNYSISSLSELVAAISTLTQEGNVTVTAVYEDEVQTTYCKATLKYVSILSSSNEPNEDGKYIVGTEIVCRADEAPEGKKFSHLLITSLGATTEYGEATYRRVLNNDIAIEAVYVDEEEEVVKPISLLLTPSMIEHNGQAAVRLYATLGFETGLHGEKVELGILRSFDPSATLTLENVGNGVEQRTTGNATDVTFANSFYASEVTSGTVYAVAYLKYIDTNGENQVLYTSVVEFSVES